MRRNKILFGAILGAFLVTSLVSAQTTIQLMRGQVKRVGDPGVDIFNCGTAGATTPDTCDLRYEYWSDDFSGEVNRGGLVTGLAEYVLRGNPKGSIRGDYNAALANIGDFPTAGQGVGKNWYLSWFGELNVGGTNHVGYYAVQGQVVDFGEFGNWNRFDCVGSKPIACFTPPGPPGSAVPAGHSVTRADGTVENPLGGLSPIPIPRASLDKQNRLINLEWDAATDVTIADPGTPNPITGYRIYVAEDNFFDRSFPDPVAGDYSPVTDVPASSTSATVSIPADLNPLSEAYTFAIQLLYRSTPNPFDAFERRSGYTLPNGDRVEGLSANSNNVDVGLLAIISNFGGAYDGGNRVRLSWEVAAPTDSIESFEVLVSKSAEGLDIGNIPSKLGSGVLGPIAYDPAVTSYETIDRNAGRTGSKINVYILQVNFTTGASALTEPVVVDLSSIL